MKTFFNTLLVANQYRQRIKETRLCVHTHLEKKNLMNSHSRGSAIFKSFHIKMLTKVSGTIRSSEAG